MVLRQKYKVKKRVKGKDYKREKEEWSCTTNQQQITAACRIEKEQ